MNWVKDMQLSWLSRSFGHERFPCSSSSFFLQLASSYVLSLMVFNAEITLGKDRVQERCDYLTMDFLARADGFMRSVSFNDFSQSCIPQRFQWYMYDDDSCALAVPPHRRNVLFFLKRRHSCSRQ